MRGLSPAKAQALDGLVRSLPDRRLSDLRSALAGFEADWSKPVRAAADAEISDRRLRDAVLREMVTLARTHEGPVQARNPISAWAPATVWRGLREIAPELVARTAELHADRDHAHFEVASLKLLTLAAEALDGGAGPFALVAERLERGLGGSARVARIAQLSPLVRRAAPRAKQWLKTAGREEASNLRFALGEASAMCADGGPLLIDMLAMQFDDPWAGLRLASAVMDKPKEAFLAGSELGVFAEAVLASVEAAVVSLRGYNSDFGRAAGASAAAAVQVATDGAEELEHWVQLDREQPWGQRVAAAKRHVLAVAETRLKEVDGLVAQALPVAALRPGVKILRGAPDLSVHVPPLTVSRAEAGLVFIDEVRRTAAKGGFAGLRGKVLEALDARIHTYADDLIDLIRSPDVEAAAQARERLHIAADFLSLVREPAAGQMLRRRLAAA